MHSVLPVTVRIENHIKNPMTGTNFQDTINKPKKRVKIGPSTFFKSDDPIGRELSFLNRKRLATSTRTNTRTENRSKSPKTRSLSPKFKSQTSIHWCPPPGRTSRSIHSEKTTSLGELNRLNRLSTELDHIPERDVPTTKTHHITQTKIKAKPLAPCKVCIEARSRSHSPVKNNNHQSTLHQKSSSFRSSTASSLLSSSSSRENSPNHPHSRSVSPSSPNLKHSRFRSEESLLEPHLDSTYTLPYSRSRSHDSQIRARCTRLMSKVDPITHLPMHPHFHSHLPPMSHIHPISCSHDHLRTVSSFECDSELLEEKLNETEAHISTIAHQLSSLRDFLIVETTSLPPQNVIHDSSLIIGRFEVDRNKLIRQMELFEFANRDLRDIIHSLKSHKSANDVRQLQENTALVKQIDALQIENNHYKTALLEYEKNMFSNGNTNEALNLENNALANLKLSLEENRAHLKKNLIKKESECSRLNVQLKTLSQKLDQLSSENKLLRENRARKDASTFKMPPQIGQLNISKPNSTTNQVNVKPSKSYFNLEEILSDPIKIRLYIDKLNNQLKEKDTTINNLNENLQIKRGKTEREHVESLTQESSKTSERSEKLAAEKLRKENEKLKKSLQVKEEKLKNSEAKLKMYQNEKKTVISTITSQINKLQNKNIQNQNSSSGDDATTNLQSISQANNSNNNNNSKKNNPEVTAQIQRIKNFSEIELNNVRSRLQERLNELEPLPEMLRNTELKLHDALSKIKNYENEIMEYRKVINELKNELDSAHNINALNKVSKHKKEKENSINHSASMQAEANLKQQVLIENLTNSKFETIEKRIIHLEDENRELHRQLTIKDDFVRDLTNKLGIKTNEASSFSRQLDLALSDANIKEQQIKQQYASKERNLQAKCNELETRLNSIQLHSSIKQRDKEDLSSDYQGQIKDLKTRLEQVQLTNKQMQEYVNFLKNSYVTYFNDGSLNSFDSLSSTNYFNSQNNFL